MFRFPFVLIFVAAALPVVGRAQIVPPSPNVELQRIQEREAQQRERLGARPPDVRLDGVAQAPGDFDALPVEAPCFHAQIDVLGPDAQPLADFAWLAAALNHDGTSDLLSHCIGARGVAMLLERGQRLLVARGYATSRLLAGPQDMGSGRLVLTLVPGHVRAVVFQPELPVDSNLDQALTLRPGDVLNLRDIEQSLENFKRVPTADADIQIAPATGADARTGDSDLLVTHRQAFPLRLTVTADDSGTKATGKYLGSVTLSVDNPLRLNDLFYFTYNGDLGGGNAGPRGLRGQTFHYSFPAGNWTFGTTWSNSTYYQNVAALNQSDIYSGTSQNNEVKATRLLTRDARQKLYGSLAVFQRRSNNYIDDTEVQNQQRIEGGWSAGLNYKTMREDATLEANLTYKQGTGAFGSMPAPEDAFGQGTSRLKVLLADLSYARPFRMGEQQLRYNAALRAQIDYTPLTPLDRFAIAGRYTVRGFDGESLLSAERGRLLRNDLSLALGDSGQEVYVGVDYGEVSGPSADLLVGRRLMGAALGLRGAVQKVNYDVFVGMPLQKPDAFVTASYVVGFSLSLGF